MTNQPPVVSKENQRPRKGTRVWSCGTRAFTLVEIVLSLGVISFAIVAPMGLMAISLGLSRDSAQDTDIASMTRQISAHLRAQQFDALVPIMQTDATYEYYFDNEVRQVSAGTGAIYYCKATLTIDPDYTHTQKVGGSNVVVRDLYQLRLDFTSALKLRKKSSSTTPSPSSLLMSVSSAIARYEPLSLP